jgi:hypothetical protein
MGMSKLGQEVEAFLKTAGSLADDFSKQNLIIKADRLDKLVNGQIIPRLGRHMAIIGSGFMVIGLDSSDAISYLFAFVAAALAGCYFVAGQTRQGNQSGLPGACAVFITASVVSAGRSGDVSILPMAVAIAIPYVIISLCVAYNEMERQELVFAPVYSALLLLLSSAVQPDALLLFVPVAIAGVLALLKIRRMGSSYGLLAGTLAVGAMQVAYPTLDIVTRGIISTANIVALQLFVNYAVGPSNSDIRNFLNQGLPALAILGTVLLLAGEPYPYWLWPVGLAAFFVCAYAIGGRGGLPTAIGWVCIAAIGAILLSRKGFSPESWEFRAGLIATLGLAQLLYLVARHLKNRFTCDLARVLLLVGALLCVNAVFKVDALWRNELSDVGRETFLSWENHAFAATLSLVFLAALFAALSYSDPTQRTPISWWRGLIQPRHAVLLRTAIRGSAKAIENIPLLGGAWKALLAGGRWLRYLKSGGDRPRLADMSVLISGILLALAVVTLVDAALWPAYRSAQRTRFFTSIPHAVWQSHTLAWTICGILLYGYGLARRQALFVFAATAFALVPVIQHIKTTDIEARGIMLFTAGLTILCCALQRWERPLGRAAAGIISIALATSIVATYWPAPAARTTATACRTRAAEYRLPKTLISLQIKAANKNARVSAKDVTISQKYIPDNSQTFCLDHLLTGDSQDDVTIEHDSAGFLASISGKANGSGRTPQTGIVRMAAAVGPAAPSRDKLAGYAVEIKFDPSDAAELKRVNASLDGFGLCLFVEELPGNGIECNTNSRKTTTNFLRSSQPERRVQRQRGRERIFYRPNLSYKLVISMRTERGGDVEWIPIIARAVQIPNAAPVLAITLREATFTDDMIRISFEHGALTDITARKRTRASEPIEVSLSPAHAQGGARSQLLRIGHNETANRRELQRAQQFLLNALTADPRRGGSAVP